MPELTPQRHSARDAGEPRVVVVTGSSSGIGRAVASALLERGDRVIGIARDHGKFRPESPHYETLEIDLGALDAAAAALDTLARRRHDVDAVVANAGYGDFGEIEQFSAARIRQAIDVNLTANLLLARSFVPVLKKQPRSDLVIVGSLSGQRGARKGALYNAAKFGVRGMSQALRDECARSSVRVTLISPGAVDTPFFDDLAFAPADSRSSLTPGDVAAVILHTLDAPDHVILDEITLSPRNRSFQKKPKS